MDIYRQIQITSTKCQYQALASKLKWWVLEKWDFVVRNILISKKDVPINTWIPWNPVAIKKIDPYTLSAIVNEDSLYSMSWSIVKYIPSIIVILKAIIVFIRFFINRLWWAQVTVNPEASNTVVFKRGTLNGSIGLIPMGGQVQPMLIHGAKLLWKNAQKNAIKKQISLIINSIIPSRRPLWTYEVCFPI